MSASTIPSPSVPAVAPVETPGTPRRRRSRSALLAAGEPSIWFTGGALVVALVMIVGLLGLIFYQGGATFWPGPLVEITTHDGRTFLGEVTRSEDYRLDADTLNKLPPAIAANARALLAAHEGQMRRRLLRTGNFDLTGSEYQWVSDYEVVRETEPLWAVTVERTDWGNCYGVVQGFLVTNELRVKDPARAEVETNDPGTAWNRFQQVHEGVRDKLANEHYFVRLQTRGGSKGDKVYDLPVEEVVLAYPANQLSFGGRFKVYLTRWVEFLTDKPRMANTEGGVLPAIWGTVAMTLLLSLLVVPFGVLAALYLREYARPGPIVSAVRIAINNLAGVPSIVFGVFGLGFFCYLLGGSVDQVFFRDRLPSPTFGTGGLLWASMTLALLTLPVVIVSTEEALAAVPSSMREGSYACGASKWQTIWRIVLPRALPGIMTGMILAMARGAGEVAPLMLVGVLKHAPELPIDGVFPFVHLQRSFMHLGFHIFDVGFQSRNSEAARPMVYTTTFLLIVIIALLNLMAVWLRSRLRRRFQVSHF